MSAPINKAGTQTQCTGCKAKINIPASPVFTCPDCGNTVSKKANACLKCGRLTELAISLQKKQSSNMSCIVSILISFFLFFFFIGPLMGFLASFFAAFAAPR